MKNTLTSIFEKSPYGFIGYVKELPGANTQGNTLEEAKKNLAEAVQLVLEANKLLAENNQTVIKKGKQRAFLRKTGFDSY